VSLLQRLADLVADGVAVAAATVVDTSRSVPRHAGAKMLVLRNGRSFGTVGGGEMEARVIAEAQGALVDGRCRLLSYRLVDPRRGDPGVCGGDVRIFVEPHMPKPTLIVMGYGHVGRAVAQAARWLGFRTLAVDDRPGIAGTAAPAAGLGLGDAEAGAGTDASLGDADTGAGALDELITGSSSELLATRQLDADSAVVLVTRNVDVDVAALPALLDSDAGYIGVMGSDRRWATTRARLIQNGADDSALERVHAPIGIEIGAETPEEIAVSIMAEVIAHRRT